MSSEVQSSESSPSAPFEMPESQWRLPIQDAVREFAKLFPKDQPRGPLPEGAIDHLDPIVGAFVRAVQVGVPFQRVWSAFEGALSSETKVWRMLRLPYQTHLTAQFLFRVARRLSELVKAHDDYSRGAVGEAADETKSQVEEVVKGDGRNPWQRPLKERV